MTAVHPLPAVKGRGRTDDAIEAAIPRGVAGCAQLCDQVAVVMVPMPRDPLSRGGYSPWRRTRPVM